MLNTHYLPDITIPPGELARAALAATVEINLIASYTKGLDSYTRFMRALQSIESGIAIVRGSDRFE